MGTLADVQWSVPKSYDSMVCTILIQFCKELDLLKTKMIEYCLQWFWHAYVSDIIKIIYSISPWNAQYGVSMSYIQRI